MHPEAGYTTCAAEGEVCNCNGVVTYGEESLAVATKYSSKSLQCSPETFGSDPAPNESKSCYCFGVSHSVQFGVVGLPIGLEVCYLCTKASNGGSLRFAPLFCRRPAASSYAAQATMGTASVRQRVKRATARGP